MEGKEVRFGIADSALFATVTTDASCGAVNAMHDSFTPLGGLVPLFNIAARRGDLRRRRRRPLRHAGVRDPRGVHRRADGRAARPSTSARRSRRYEMKMAMLAVLCLPLSILGFTALRRCSPAGLAGSLNAGPHGFCEILYAYTSATGNNGSAFAGITPTRRSTTSTLGLAMLIGPLLDDHSDAGPRGLAGGQEDGAAVGRHLPDRRGRCSSACSSGVILIVGGLTFFPALALGPIVEHFLMNAGTALLQMSADRVRRHGNVDEPTAPCSQTEADARTQPSAPTPTRARAREGDPLFEPRSSCRRSSTPSGSSTRARLVAQPGHVRGRGWQRADDLILLVHRPVHSARRRRLRRCRSSLWLWFTVLFANFAEAMAEGRGKAQADTLRRTRTRDARPSSAPRGDGATTCERDAPAEPPQVGDVVLIEAGDLIPGDGEIIEGVATVDEFRDHRRVGSGDPRERRRPLGRHRRHDGPVGLARVRVTADPGETFLDRMIALVEGAKRPEDAERDRA